jgi:hypothetical protein
MTCRIRFSDDDIKAEMILLPWNNFLQPLLHFVIVRFDHDDCLVRISLLLKPINGIELGRFTSVFLILPVVAEGRHKKEEIYAQFCLECWPHVLRPFAEYLPMQPSIRIVIHMFGIEI